MADSDGGWFKWAVGAIIALLGAGGGIVALITYVHPGPPNPDGSWRYEMQSDGSPNKLRGSLEIVVSGDRVSGSMSNPDPQKPNETSAIEGSYLNNGLTLDRNTNQSGVFQRYTLRREGDGFAGRFENIGQKKGSYYSDSGSFYLHR
jgi:hypothetical protein